MKPTWDMVETALQARRTALSGMHRDQLDDEAMYHWSADDYRKASGWAELTGLPPNFKPSFPPWAYLGIQVAVNHIMSGDVPDVKVEFATKRRADGSVIPESPTKKARRRLLQAWYGAWLYTVATYKTENPFRELVLKLDGLGQGALSYPVDWSARPDPPRGWADKARRIPRAPRNKKEQEALERWERQRRAAFPWNVESIHPTRLFFDLSHDPPRDFIREEEVDAGAVASQYPELAKGRGWEEGTKLTRVTYCSADWYGEWIDGVPCLTEADGADEEGIAPVQSGVPWLRMAWSGMGDTDADADWSHRGMGMLRNGRTICLDLTVASNMFNCMVQTYGMPGQDIHGGSDAQQTLVADTYARGPGVINKIPGEVRVAPQETPAPPPMIMEQYNEKKQLYNSHFGAEVLRGEYHSEAASKERARAARAELPFESPKANAEQLVAAVLADIALSVKYELREPVALRGYTLRPEDVDEDDEAIITVDFTPMTDEDRAFKRAALKEDLDAGAITLREYIEQSRDIEDGEQVLDDVRKERMTDALLADANLAMAISGVVLAKLQEKGILPPPAPPLPPAGDGGQSAAPPPGAAAEGSPEPQPGGSAFAQPPPQAMEDAEALYNVPTLARMPGVPVNGR